MSGARVAVWFAVAAAPVLLRCSRPATQRSGASERRTAVSKPVPEEHPAPAPVQPPAEHRASAEAPSSQAAPRQAPRKPSREPRAVPRWKRILESGDPGILSKPSPSGTRSAPAAENDTERTPPPVIAPGPAKPTPSGAKEADKGPVTLCSWMAYGQPQMWCTHGSVDKARAECAKLASGQLGQQAECDCTQNADYIGDACKSASGSPP